MESTSQELEVDQQNGDQSIGDQKIKDGVKFLAQQNGSVHQNGTIMNGNGSCHCENGGC